MVRNGVLSKAITYSTITATEVGKLPPNAYIYDIKVLVTEAFNAASTDYVDIGTTASANRYADNVDVSSTTAASVTDTAYWGVVESTTEPTIVNVVYVPTGSSPTTGAAKIVVCYAFNE